IGLITMAVSASHGPRAGTNVRTASPNPALYGNMGGMGAPLASVLGPATPLRPNYGPASPSTPASPVSIPRAAPQQMAMRWVPPAPVPDLMPPPILLYRPNPPDQTPPPLAAATPAPPAGRVTPLPFIGSPP